MNTINLQSIKLSIVTLAFCLTGMANADYSCISHDGKIKIETKNYEMTRLGDTSVIVESEDETVTYYGNKSVFVGNFMTKQVVGFIDHSGFLTIVTKPKFCGRGSCDYNSGPIITGKLALNNSEIYFSCHE